MNINNNFNVLPWYYSVDQQNANKWYAYGNVWPLVSSNSQLIPFQLVIDKPVTAIGTIKVHKLSDGSAIDSGLKPISLPASDASYTILSLITNTLPSALTEGRYYCSMNIDGTDIYSEVFTVVPDLSKYIKVTYWNEDNIVYKGGAIDYSNGFKYYIYICSDVAKPEYPFEEELTKRAGYKFLESQISSKLYKFTFVAPEFICDAMRLIRLNDYIQVESRGQKYNALNFTYNPKWEEQGDLASVECEFETDNIIQKLESFNRRQQESFYNALLANANDPILFDAGVVAQYYKDSQATGLVEGKLIRELDEALIVDAPSYIPVDNGIGAAKKLDLKTILAKYAIKTEVYESLAAKWTYDNERATKWDNAATDSHTHANKAALDLIAYDAAKKTWRFTGNIALSGVVSMYADLGDLDIPNIYAGLPIDNRTIKRDINGMLFAESTTGGSFDETAMWTALGTNISTKLIATKYLNLAGYATEAFVLEKIQGLGAVFNLKGTKPTPSDLPKTGNKIGDVWYVASESVGYIWLTDEKGVLRWEKFGEPVDLSAYYTKAEVDTKIATKWTTDQALITNWNDAYSLRHSHSNKAILDGINNTLINNWNSAATNSHTHANKAVIDGITAGLINNWNSAATDSHTHANKSALDLIAYDAAKKTWRFTGNIALSGVVSMYADLGDLDIPSIYAGLPIDNRTIKRDALGMLYSVSGGGSDFDKTAMWAALASTTAEQINKTHLTDALSTYVLNTDSRLSDSRNAKDVYAWAKASTKPTYSYDEITSTPPVVDLSNYVTLNTTQTIQVEKRFLDGARYGIGSDYYFGSNGNVRANQYIKAGGNAGQVLRADGGVSTFSFVGQAGQPAFVWGSAGTPHDYKVWNPANFNVATSVSSTKIKPTGGGVIDANILFEENYIRFHDTITRVGSANLFPTINNANGILSFSTHPSGFGHQVGFSSDGDLYNRYIAANVWQSSWKKILNEGNWQSTIDGRYLLLTGGSLSGRVSINSSNHDLLYLKNIIDGGASLLYFKSGETNKSEVGWTPSESWGSILFNSASRKCIGIKDDGTPHYTGSTLWHAGNDGSGSGLDADTLDGMHDGLLTANRITLSDSMVAIKGGFDLNLMGPNFRFIAQYGSSTYWNNAPVGLNYGGVFQMMDSRSGIGGQLAWDINHNSVQSTNNLYFRACNNLGWQNDWKEIAFLTSNVASATKLQTPRLIYGQYHDGTADVNGNFTTNGNITAAARIYTDSYVQASRYITGSRFFAGYDAGVTNSVSCSDWFRSNGNSGWYNDTHRVGIYAKDSIWLRAYGTNKFAVDNIEADSIWTKGGIKADGTTIQLGTIKMIVSAATKSIRFEMADGTPCNVVSSGGVVMYGN